MKSKQEIKEQIDLFEVNGADYDEITDYCLGLNETEEYIFITELEYRGIIYDYDGYPVIPDRYNRIWEDMSDADCKNIAEFKRYLEEIL